MKLHHSGAAPRTATPVIPLHELPNGVFHCDIDLNIVLKRDMSSSPYSPNGDVIGVTWLIRAHGAWMNLRDGLHTRVHTHTCLALVVTFCPTIGRMSHATAFRCMMILPTRFIYLFPCVNAHFSRDASRKCRETRVFAKLTAICER